MSVRDESVVRRDAVLWAHVADLWSLQATLEGMKARNTAVDIHGAPPVHGEDAFEEVARQMEDVGRRIRAEV